MAEPTGRLGRILRGFAVAAALVAAVGCATGGSDRAIVEPRTLPESSRRPRIVEVVDLGGGDVPLDGHIERGRSDGTLVVGETILIRGKGFGRQPTVTIAGRAAGRHG